MSEPVTDPADEPTDVPAEPTPEQYAARARRADKATRGGLAAVLALQALIILLVPRAIRYTTGLGVVRTTILFVIAALLIVGAGTMRRSWGVAFGSALQVVFFATGFFLVSMFFVGLIFAAIWYRILMLRNEIVGTSGGWRMLLE